jgi:hypothetical protein
MRSRTEGTISRSSWLLSLICQALGDGLVEVERSGCDRVTGARDHDRLLATAIGEAWRLAMARRDPPLSATLEDRMGGDSLTVRRHRTIELTANIERGSDGREASCSRWLVSSRINGRHNSRRRLSTRLQPSKLETHQARTADLVNRVKN